MDTVWLRKPRTEMGLKPKCTIYLNWTGPSCGKPAVSRNEWGGFQCEWHSSLKRHKDNPIGPYEVISGNGLLAKLRLQMAYIRYLLSRKKK
jgi:hypothetical protein